MRKMKPVESNNIDECIKKAKIRYKGTTGISEFFVFAREGKETIYFADDKDIDNSAIRHYQTKIYYVGQRADWRRLK